MKESINSAESRLTLRDFTKNRRIENYHTRIKNFTHFLETSTQQNECFYRRKVISPMDREVLVHSSFENQPKKMLMFGSNNYLGLANHPYVTEKMVETVQQFGTGIGGPPLLNGYTHLIHELEQRLARFKGQEDALIFSSGYATNLGLFSILPSAQDIVLVDAHHHASCFDGLTFGKIPFKTFPHNDLDALKKLLICDEVKRAKDVFVAVEGVYSMRGDLGPLNDLVELSKAFNFHLILDDAHGTGVLGKNGSGTADHFNVKNKISIVMGTFSKTFAVAGGFVAGSKEMINYLRYFARPYIFSGSLAPSQAAAVLAGLDLLEKDDALVKKLWENIKYAQNQLQKIGVTTEGGSAIFTLPVPEKMPIRKGAYLFHSLGIFINAIEYPAVPKSQECFRVSVIANHTKEDIDQLILGIQKVWKEWENEKL